MLTVGLTGGIGSGKSTVSAMLEARGAVIVDADKIAREVVEPGTPGYDAIVEGFGDAVVAVDGALDRAALAAIVFNDEDARLALNGIVHPAVGVAMAERMQSHAETDDVLILDVPLLVESRRPGMTGVIVVDCPEEIAVQRLVEQRGFDEEDARNRIAAQASREERRAIADVVIDNSGSLEDLVSQVDAAWAWIDELRASAEDGTAGNDLEG
jgi:dephospho-CoA kinase